MKREIFAFKLNNLTIILLENIAFHQLINQIESRRRTRIYKLILLNSIYISIKSDDRPTIPSRVHLFNNDKGFNKPLPHVTRHSSVPSGT